MELDTIFGLAQQAAGQGSRAWEVEISPQSLTRMRFADPADQPRAHILDTMRAAQDGCLISGYFFESTTIIWIIDEHGSLNMAVEEAAHPETHRPTIPILQHHRPASQGWRKLGHVALLDAPHLGRIAGEIVLRRQQGLWELNNSSGRFGLKCGRTQQQLASVGKVFVSLGLRIDIDFL